MTDNDIIKALECCAAPFSTKCKVCPLFNKDLCQNILLEKALDLINRQKAKIEEFADIGKMYSEVKAEAVKEFAKRLKKKETTAINCKRFEGVVSTDDIDTLVKEMVGEIERDG